MQRQQLADNLLNVALHEQATAIVRNKLMRVQGDSTNIVKTLLTVYTDGSGIIRECEQTDAAITGYCSPLFDLLNQVASNAFSSKILRWNPSAIKSVRP